MFTSLSRVNFARPVFMGSLSKYHLKSKNSSKSGNFYSFKKLASLTSSNLVSEASKESNVNKLK